MRDRLYKLNQYFHVSDVTQNLAHGHPSHNKLAHILSFTEQISLNLKSQYHPHCETSIDEARIAFTGRLAFKQYVPMKQKKIGIKVWMLADPHNCYVNDFQVYTGKVPNQPEQGIGERVVKDLTRDIWG